MQLPQLIPISDEALKRPKILLLADDLRAPSGIGTMSKELVFNTADRFNWVQIAATINHPDQGKILDISEMVTNETGIQNPSVKLYPYKDYGDANILRYILIHEKPDAILHFTDPRYWNWLYVMEHEIRSEFKIPIMYYSIWDDLPYPHWNLAAYSSCDLLMAISKQTHLIHQKVLQEGGFKFIDMLTSNEVESKDSKTSLCTYVPHGIDSKKYRPIVEGDPEYDEYLKFEENFVKKHNSKFVIFWNNRNIRRKQPGDVIFSFKLFCDQIAKREGIEEAKKCVLLLHTHPQDPNGTDLIAVKDNICPDYNIVFSVDRVPTKILNFYYNIADVTLNIGSNEGFGLSSAESIMAGTPVINNVTGGLQDQMGFLDHTGKEYWPTDEVSSNHGGEFFNYGKWAYAVYPSNRSMQGSLETPYIFDDRALPEDVADKMGDCYHTTREERKRNGLEGRKWLIETAGMESKTMGDRMVSAINVCLSTFKPKPSVDFMKIEPKKKNKQIGISRFKREYDV